MRQRRHATDGPGGRRRASRTAITVAVTGAVALLGASSPAAAHEADDFKAGDVLAALAPSGEAVNMTAVANVPHRGVTTPQAAQSGSDIEFFRAKGRDYALAGTLRNGLQINDVTDPTAPVKTAVYDCPVTQGDVQVFRQKNRVLATYTADSRIGATALGAQCVREANALGFALDGSELGTFLVDLTRPSAPRTVGFAEVAQGSHNMTVHPSGRYLYNSNSDLITNTTPDITIFDIADPPRHGSCSATRCRSCRRRWLEPARHLLQPVRRPRVRRGALADRHPGHHRPGCTQAAAWAPRGPRRAFRGPDPRPAIHVVHQSDTVTLTRKDGSRRTLLVITDERAGAAASAECPGGGLHVYDVTGALERTPRKLGTWFIGAVGPVEAGDVCTSHVLRMHDEQALLTIAWYSQGVRVLDIAGLADYEPPAGQGDAAWPSATASA
jgi:hypothetical protein